jgi:hypothetical protein
MSIKSQSRRIIEPNRPTRPAGVLLDVLPSAIALPHVAPLALPKEFDLSSRRGARHRST